MTLTLKRNMQSRSKSSCGAVNAAWRQILEKSSHTSLEYPGVFTRMTNNKHYECCIESTRDISSIGTALPRRVPNALRRISTNICKTVKNCCFRTMEARTNCSSSPAWKMTLEVTKKQRNYFGGDRFFSLERRLRKGVWHEMKKGEGVIWLHMSWHCSAT